MNGAPYVYFFVSPDFGRVQTLPDLENTIKKNLQNHCLLLQTLQKIVSGLVLEFEAKLREE